MAFFILMQADHAELEKSGRSFRCSTCLVNPTTGKEKLGTMKARRCKEDRWDFTEKDGAAFPIQVTPGGPTFGFCPAKVQRDSPEILLISQTLTAILETNTWPDAGGIHDQDPLWVELVAIFGPLKKMLEFESRYKLVRKGILNGLGKN